NAIENFFIVISELDWIFHNYYHRIVRKRINKNLREILSCLDKGISKIIKKADRRDLDIIIVSDHGFRVYKKLVSVGDILRRYHISRGVSLKFISSKKRKKSILRTITKQKTSLKTIFLKKFWELAISSKITMINPKKVYDIIIRGSYRVLPDSRISPAFVLLNIPAFFVAINRKIKRNKKILIRYIIKKLRSLHDNNGNPLFSIVKKRTSLYWGPYIKRAPHIGIFGNINAGYLTSAILTGTTIINRRTNYHDFDAIFIAKSEHIPRGDLGQISIYDIAPTIMSIGNVPIQKGLDGEPLTNKKVSYTNYIGKWQIVRRLRKKL
ncbi:MAG: alkaline phosphatase family protein, partial [Candidatus Njordarchaeota archaeon]